MRRQSLFLIFILCAISITYAQPSGVDPFSDAVPLRTDSNNKLFLTNQDAVAVKAFFENQRNFRPERIIKMDHGFYHGYRIYYTNTSNPETGSEPWIQVFTVNTRECIEAHQRSNSGLLEAPFLGVKKASEKYGYATEDVENLINQYKQIATRYYREFDDEQSNRVNEMNMVFQKYMSKIESQSGQMFATGGKDYITKPVSGKVYTWELWEQCLEEVDQAGYNTMIEYSEVPASGSRL
jgi:hypothetical protein